MKKKIAVFVVACITVFAMTGCEKEKKETKIDVDVEIPDIEVPDIEVPDIEVPDIDVPDIHTSEQSSEEAPDGDVTTEASSNGTANEITISNLISLSIAGTNYTEYPEGTNDITKVYAESNQLQTVAISAINITGMTGMEEQFKTQLESLYGKNYKLSTATYNGITYTVYDYGTNNAMTSEINVTAYVYIDDSLAIYCEEAWAEMLGSSSGDTERLLNTVTIL